ncbi:MAG: DUF3288 family protein [Gloeocapsa sp. DLM2.Bin57]|jgi:hypothetical protein|nr:MAG: DUF3288 family protein [Gloeocapsa sp. DLM2.Bin57]
MAELQHPQAQKDGEIIAQILDEKATAENLATIARLIIRYENFPGAKEIKQRLNQILQQWGLDQETLFAQTRQFYSEGKLGNERLAPQETQDWS